MMLRTLLLPAALLATLFVFSTDEAHARGGAYRTHGAVHGTHGRRLHSHGGVVVGTNVAIPVRHRGGYYREVVEVVGGYYETRTREVEVPGRRIGHDRYGRPIFAGTRIEIETYEVWVPRREIVRQIWVPARRVGTVTIGATYRFR
jgi:hypothetical protein